MLEVLESDHSTKVPYRLRYQSQRNKTIQAESWTEDSEGFPCQSRKLGKKDEKEECLYHRRKKGKYEQKDCRTVHYQCKRKNFGRLDYNANLAGDIVKKLRGTSTLATLVNEVPYIVNENHFDLTVQIPVLTGQKPQFDFARLLYADYADNHRASCTCVPVIAFGQDKMDMTMNQCFDGQGILHFDMTDLTNSQFVTEQTKNFLTIFFEKKIFSFAEMVLARLDKCYQLRSKNVETRRLLIIRRDILSLLDRKLREHESAAIKDENSTLRNNCNGSPKNLGKPMIDKIEKEKLAENKQQLQDLGVLGIGNTYDGFTIFLKDPEKNTDRKAVSSNIQQFLSSTGVRVRPDIVWITEMKTAKCVSMGDRINDATVGAFLHNGNQWKIISAGHAFRCGHQVYFNGGIIGTCIISKNRGNFENDLVDIALIDLKPGLEGVPMLRIENGTEISYTARVFNGTEDDLKNKRFHKVGASTQWTNGKYFGHLLDGFPLGGIVIQGVEDTEFNATCFSARGDSGAIVFFFDKEDKSNRTIELVSIISSMNYHTPKKPIPIDVPENLNVVGVTITAGLDKCLKCVNEENHFPLDSFQIT